MAALRVRTGPGTLAAPCEDMTKGCASLAAVPRFARSSVAIRRRRTHALLVVMAAVAGVFAAGCDDRRKPPAPKVVPIEGSAKVAARSAVRGEPRVLERNHATVDLDRTAMRRSNHA